MSKLAFFLLFFVVVSNATFIRPWENASWVASNPNIFSAGVEVWWNLPELEKTLDSMTFSDSIDDTGVLDELTEARKARNSALKNYNECKKLPGLVKLWALPGYSAVALIASFNAASSCTEYEKNWKSSIEHSLSALELSEARAAKSLSASSISFKRILHAGLCNISFQARPDTPCDSGMVIFSSSDSSITEGDYGTLSIYDNYSEGISQQLRTPNPDLSLIGPSFDLLWGDAGAISVLDTLNNQSLEALAHAESQYNVLKQSARTREHQLESRVLALKNQKIHLIKRAPSLSEPGSAGTVSDNFNQLQIHTESTDLAFEETELTRNSLFLSGYLAAAITNMNASGANYSRLISDADSLRDEAQLAVEQQMEEALLEIARTNQEKKLTPDSIELLQKANLSFSSAYKSSALGTQFELFSEAAAFARMARMQRSPESEILVQASISKLKNLIQSAKKDGIDVTTEEETLSLLEGLEDYEIEVYVQSAISNIISKAQSKYDAELLRTRAILLKKISLGQTATQDLLTELQNIEDGLLKDGSIIYPGAIGNLKTLKSGYLYIEEELEFHLSEILGNAMSSSASPVFSQVFLDSPADVSLDIVLTNPLQYGATNVAVPVTVTPNLPFLYSDVISGKNSLSAMYLDGDSMIFAFSNVSPFESKRVSISKNLTLAHTVSKDIRAVAMGNAMARVNEVLEFELDFPIPHLELLQGNTDATIDGADPARPLAAGKHTLRREYFISDAYDESVSNTRAYPVGPKSQVEYVITIFPNIDLDVVPILVEVANSSGISSLSIYSITGESMSKPKKLSETSYSSEISDLAANLPAKIHVGYLIEDSKSFFESEIASYQNADLGPVAQELLDSARSQADAGNYSEGIRFLSELGTVHKSEQAELGKLEKKISDLSKKLTAELSELDAALPSDTSNSAFISKLEARKLELEKLSNEMPVLNLTERLANLEAVDFKWLGKEVNAYAKESYKEYNDLKERFFKAGNSSIVPEFLSFEASLNRLQVSPQVAYAVDVVGQLESVSRVVGLQEQSLAAELSTRQSLVEDIKKKANSILDPYTKQLAAAKGTDYSSRFIVSQSTVEKLIKAAEDSIDADPRLFQEKTESLNRTVLDMALVLSSLENESMSSIALLEHLVNQLPESELRSNLQNNLLTMKKLHESREYVNSLRAGIAISEKIKQPQNAGDGGLVVLGISAIAILAALAFYLFKPKPKPALKKVPKLADF